MEHWNNIYKKTNSPCKIMHLRCSGMLEQMEQMEQINDFIDLQHLLR